MIQYEEFEEAVKVFGLIGLESKKSVKEKYIKLSKKYHPDMPEGSTEKFQEINRAYKILMAYIEDFRFRFTKEEFLKQNPFAMTDTGQWSLW